MASSNSPILSDSERKFLEIAMTCLKAPPELDLQKIAEIMGVKPKSASNKWWEIRKKLFAGQDESTSGSSPADGGEPSTPSTAGKRKRGPAKKGNDENTPTKKTRGRPRAATAIKKAAKGKGSDPPYYSDMDNFADESNLSSSDQEKSLSGQTTDGDDMKIDIKDEAVKDEANI